MIGVRIYYQGPLVTGFSISGHSDFSVKGSDIVCSAISALSQTAVLALVKVAGITPITKRQAGLLKCRLPADVTEDQLITCQVILKTILTGIDSIAKEYPDYIRISSREV